MHPHPQRQIMSCALVVMVLGLLVLSSGPVSEGSQMSSVISVAASVEPNPYNTLMKQIREKEQKLVERERAIEQATAQPSAASGKSGMSFDLAKSAYAFLAVLFGLLFFTHLYFDKKYPLQQA